MQRTKTRMSVRTSYEEEQERTSRGRKRERERERRMTGLANVSRKAENRNTSWPGSKRASACVTPENHRRSSVANSLFPSGSFPSSSLLVRFVAFVGIRVFTLIGKVPPLLAGQKVPWPVFHNSGCGSSKWPRRTIPWPLSSFSRAGNVLIGVQLSWIHCRSAYGVEKF